MNVYQSKNETRLNELINRIELGNSFLSPKRDKELLYVLQMVLTLSMDGSLKELIEILHEKFPDYGKTHF
ncbi:hypothetical protein Cycma_3144 [Cyclobacterium marinum DSM 745]|uniref:Uncharacterized protein n=1 Tax=Cyclobacterium marinum (strain ATCC 25205 / DSM 745 / LMG 13164 / NCIMB 1802) TaxID=880070 RepID=G0J6Y1_CYCMS|nr:hypothetical protein Cycma_3144 [Cyclobacterium marinum DSM 745]